MSKEDNYDEAPLKVEVNKNHFDLRQSWPAVAVICIGVLLLAANLFHVHLMQFLWPGFVIAPGLMLMWPAYDSTAERQRPLSFLAVPGAMMLTVGMLLFAMNMVNHFEAWAYSWPLVLASVAGALMYIKRFEPQNTVHENGHKFVRMMILLFMGLAAFFEVLIFESFAPLFPLALIGYGIYLLVQKRQTQVA
ncbi:MAG: hypothetical protein KC421_23590 [Anaerolineales bacterium]|nr:hypothetical protein [Anaerolineales bacterium]